MNRIIIILPVLALAALGCASTPSSAKTDAAQPAAVKIYAFGFEDGTAGDWKPRGPMKMEVTDTTAHEGTKSLLTINRGDTWQDPELDLVPLMKSAGEYEVTCWVQTPEGSDEVSVKMTVEVVADGNKNWVQICNPESVAPGAWVKLTGTFSNQGGLTKAGLYIEPLDPNVSFYLDEVAITKAP